jgi:hypothetical protein
VVEEEYDEEEEEEMVLLSLFGLLILFPDWEFGYC